MQEQVIHSSELTVTYIHKVDNLKKQETWSWLDGTIKAGKQNEIPEITVVYDPDTKKLLVYDGNVRVAHATQNNYKLRAWVIFNQQDLDEYFRDHKILWWGITDFSELLKYMRICAESPREDEEASEKYQEKIGPKIQEQHERYREQQREIFGWYDD